MLGVYSQLLTDSFTWALLPIRFYDSRIFVKCWRTQGMNLLLREEEELQGQDEAPGLASKCWVSRHTGFVNIFLQRQLRCCELGECAGLGNSPWPRQGSHRKSRRSLWSKQGTKQSCFGRRRCEQEHLLPATEETEAAFTSYSWGGKGRRTQSVPRSLCAPGLVLFVLHAPFCWHQLLRKIALILSWQKAAESAKSSKLVIQRPAEQGPSASCPHAPTA